MENQQCVKLFKYLNDPFEYGMSLLTINTRDNSCGKFVTVLKT